MSRSAWIDPQRWAGVGLAALGLAVAWLGGLWLTQVLDLPLPGALTGMALLTLLLVLYPAAGARLDPLTRPLLGTLPLFFVPAGAKVVALAPRLARDWLPISAVVVLSTLFALVTTAWTVRWALGWSTRATGDRP